MKKIIYICVCVFVYAHIHNFEEKVFLWKREKKIISFEWVFHSFSNIAVVVVVFLSLFYRWFLCHTLFNMRQCIINLMENNGFGDNKDESPKINSFYSLLPSVEDNTTANVDGVYVYKYDNLNRRLKIEKTSILEC